MKKIIVFNALQTSLSGGIGRYSYELAKELYKAHSNTVKIVIRDQDRELFDFVEEKNLLIAKDIKNSKDRNLYEQFKLPNLVSKLYPDAILHYPDTMAPILAKNKVIITIHDLAFKSSRNIFTWNTVLWKNIITNLSIKKANKIISITEFTKSEIIKFYPKYEKSNISVIYNGFNNFSQETIDQKKISDKIKEINYEYVLTVSTISPRKNIDGLIKAFNLVKDSVTFNLIIAGANGWLYEDVHQLVKDLNLESRILFTGKINDEELKYLYKNALKFTYLSFYEGFGLPPLEAMSFNIPCIVANTSCLPEVVGNAAIKVDPYNIEEIADSLLNTDEIKKNEMLLEAKSQIEKYSWVKCAKEVYEVYKNV